MSPLMYSHFGMVGNWLPPERRQTLRHTEVEPKIDWQGKHVDEGGQNSANGSGLPFLLCTGRGYKQFLFFGAYKCRWPASQHHVPSFPRASQSLTLPNPIYISQHFLHSSTSKPTQTPAQYVWKGRPAYTWAWLPYSEIQPLLSISDCKNQQSYCSAIALPLM
jgi:hypothetical protein